MVRLIGGYGATSVTSDSAMYDARSTLYDARCDVHFITHTLLLGATGVTTDSTGVNHCDNSRPNLCLEEGMPVTSVTS